jgi:hypothetical protein
MRSRKVLWCLALAPLLVVPWLGPRPRRAPAAEVGKIPDAAPSQLVGSGSCAGRGCHGAIEPVRDDSVQQNEFTTWVSRDRHAQAYTVLFDERSRRIQENLNGAEPAERRVSAEHNPLCLRCHAADPEAPHGPTFSAAEGVGCESCHGPAAKWLREHARAKKTPKELEDLGMHPLHSAGERAKACVTCHVGTAAADVNHDLIAAGHPRLEFEFATYFANMPHHWVEKRPEPASEARAWVVGQVVAARAALELLAARAAAPSKPWPEFAEYSCFACHQQLRVPWPAEDSYADRRRGSLPPSTWYRGMGQALARTQAAADAVTSINEVVRLLRQPYGDRAKVVQAARQAAEKLLPLQDQLAQLPEDPAALRKWLAGLVAEEGGREMTWDRAAQLYLASAAVADARDEKVKDALARLLKALEFPAKQDSPGERSPSEDFKKSLQDLDTLLKRP